ncbi:MAG: DUF2238 domain-containing protein [Planctomycetota bacterium]|nr:MAG: DUF2238 domain-containing protein [Planctomycetota bacterium]
MTATCDPVATIVARDATGCPSDHRRARRDTLPDSQSVAGACPPNQGFAASIAVAADAAGGPNSLGGQKRAARFKRARKTPSLSRVPAADSTAATTGSARAAASPRLPLALLAIVALALLASGIAPFDRLTWCLEVFPVLLAAPLLALTWRRFPLTSLAYVLVALHALVLILGGRYTYAEVPLGYWLRDALGLERNPYDRIGHFAQGFVPAIVAREILVRTSPLRPGAWLAFLVACVCVAISALYEFIEWWTALATGEAADAFLGTQGDVWDTQWDMFTCLCGAVVALLLLSRVHTRRIAALTALDSTRASTASPGS